MEAVRESWKGFPNARRSPFVLKGDTFASDYYWHGKIMTQYAKTGSSSGPPARGTS